MSETVRTYNCTRTPNLPGVYSVIVNVNGVSMPKTSDHPEVFAYWDGVDCWSCWDFSKSGARRAPMAKKSVRYPWRETDGKPTSFI